jgi:hypothetical protein
VEESLGDGPLNAQEIPISSGRPGSGILLLTETPDAQHPHPSEAPQPSQPKIKTKHVKSRAQRQGRAQRQSQAQR